MGSAPWIFTLSALPKPPSGLAIANLSGPVLRDTARLSQRYPPIVSVWVDKGPKQQKHWSAQQFIRETKDTVRVSLQEYLFTGSSKVTSCGFWQKRVQLWDLLEGGLTATLTVLLVLPCKWGSSKSRKSTEKRTFCALSLRTVRAHFDLDSTPPIFHPILVVGEVNPY